MASVEEHLRNRLDAVSQGALGWSEFEVVGVDTLTHLFVPPLTRPQVQARTYSGIDRRDAIFPNRNHAKPNGWGQLLNDVEARMVLIEFKNFGGPVGKDEVNQTRNYLTPPLGRFAIVIARNGYDRAAYTKRNSVYSEDKKVILLLTADDLKEMLYMKERGEDPVDLIMDNIERFYIEYE
ncbi:MAG: hypothetical protein ABIP57_14450 [Jatrophihabitantaceae bacterium]